MHSYPTINGNRLRLNTTLYNMLHAYRTNQPLPRWQIYADRTNLRTNCMLQVQDKQLGSKIKKELNMKQSVCKHSA